MVIDRYTIVVPKEDRTVQVRGEEFVLVIFKEWRTISVIRRSE